MPKKTYNKLVRDKIPEIIEAAGKDCAIKVLSEKEYLAELDKKLAEELKEYLESGSVGELADIEEVLLAILTAKGVSEEEFIKLRLAKKEERGGFEKRLFLIETEEK